MDRASQTGKDKQETGSCKKEKRKEEKNDKKRADENDGKIQ